MVFLRGLYYKWVGKINITDAINSSESLLKTDYIAKN